MTSVYQENIENGHQIANIEKSDKLSELSQKMSDSKSIEQQFKTWRVQLLAIVNQFSQVKDLEELVEVITAVIREKIQEDRVLIYRFDSSSSGVVLGESMNEGWTPTVGESLPAMIFGLDTRQEYLEAVSIEDIKLLCHEFRRKSSNTTNMHYLKGLFPKAVIRE